MRENDRLPEVRDFPAWKAERRDWFISAEEIVEEDWILANGDHLRVVAQPLPDGGLRLIVEDRTEQVRLASARDTLLRVRAATFDNLFEAISVFASRRPALSVEPPLLRGVGRSTRRGSAEHPRVDELVPAMARKPGQPDRRGAGPRAGPLDHQRAPVGHGPRVDDRRPPFRIRRGAAARRQLPVHDDRRHRFDPHRGRAARARHRARGGRPGQDRLRRQHELRIAHAADLDRRLRRDARRGLCRQARAQPPPIMSARSSNRSRACRS